MMIKCVLVFVVFVASLIVLLFALAELFCNAHKDR